MGSHIRVHDCHFEQNGVNQSHVHGGAILGRNHSQIYVDTSMFVRNRAIKGGAIYAGLGSEVIINHSVFEYNQAGCADCDESGSGGAVYMAGFGSVLVIESTTFLGNDHQGQRAKELCEGGSAFSTVSTVTPDARDAQACESGEPDSMYVSSREDSVRDYVNDGFNIARSNFQFAARSMGHVVRGVAHVARSVGRAVGSFLSSFRRRRLQFGGQSDGVQLAVGGQFGNVGRLAAEHFLGSGPSACSLSLLSPVCRLTEPPTETDSTRYNNIGHEAADRIRETNANLFAATHDTPEPPPREGGGAIFIGKDSQLTLLGGRFSMNTADGYGSAILVEARSQAMILSTVFEENVGGAAKMCSWCEDDFF